MITPPPELVEQWEAETAHTTKDETWHVAVQAARWGADMELEACCEWVVNTRAYDMSPGALRTARRPKAPSLKEQALEAMDRCDNEIWCEETERDLAIIRTALEQLND